MTEPLPPRAVKPRTRKYKRLPIVVVTGTTLVDEDGMVWPRYTGAGRNAINLPEYPSTLFVTIGAGDFVAELDAIYSKTHPESWQWQVSTQEKGIVRPGGFRVASRVTAVVKQFGFKNGKYHKVIDPVVMYGRKLDDIWPGDESIETRLMRWGQAVRDFCDANGMEVRPTIGSISSQFLTDRRFYPNARRKVPRAINDRARENLPGNHYGLAAEPSPDREFTAWYIDQRRAHHYHAAHTPLPDANNLYAHGRFTDLGDVTLDNVYDDFYGLYCLKLEVPRIHHRFWHWVNPHNPHTFVFSNELPLLLDMGYKVNGVVAAWGSHSRDHGIGRYACWADRQLDNYQDAAWIKPLLLATYGTLATRPSWGETVFRLAKRGREATVYTGRRSLTGLQTAKPVKLEPGIANVIHRGMIEAGTRAESIRLARYLADHSLRVLSIYADAVIVQQPGDEDPRTLPALPEPWRLKSTLTHLQFINQQAFISGEMTRLPGINREIRAYTQHAPKHAPRRRLWDALAQRPIKTDRRI